MCPIVAPSSLRFYKNLILHDELGTVKLARLYPFMRHNIGRL
jgi:hypothetical protein